MHNISQHALSITAVEPIIFYKRSRLSAFHVYSVTGSTISLVELSSLDPWCDFLTEDGAEKHLGDHKGPKKMMFHGLGEQ